MAFSIKSDLFEQIILGIKNKEERYENIFYAKYKELAFNYAYKRCFDKISAPDVAQNAIAVTMLRIRDGRFNPEYEGHLINSIRNTIFNLCASIARKKIIERDTIKTITELNIYVNITSQDEIDNFKEELFQAVDKAMKQLKKNCEKIIKEFYINELTMQEIIEKLTNINTEGYARNLKYRCINDLRKLAINYLKKIRNEN